MLDFATIAKADPGPSGVHVPTALGNSQTPVQSPAPVTQVPPKKKKLFADVLNDATEQDIVKFEASSGLPHLKPMDQDNSFTPFPFDPNALAHIRPDQTPRFYSALTDSDKLPRHVLPLNSLVATQNRVSTSKTQAIAAGGGTAGAGGKAPVVARMQGRNYIIDGHHRAAADYLNGAENVTAHYIDLEPHSNALKDWEVPFTVAKSVPAQQLIFGWASVVEKDGKIIIDKQGSIILPEDLEVGAYDFMLKSRDQGHMHQSFGMGRCIESMVFTKEKQAILGIDLKKVGWWIGFKVDDSDVWKAHQRGDLTEFSIGGTGKRINV